MLPPNLVGSLLQGTLQQRQVQQLHSTTERRQSDMNQAVIRAGEQHETQIEGTNADSESDPDGSGGGQGRAFQEQPQPGLPDAEQMPIEQQAGITPADHGREHLDITA